MPAPKSNGGDALLRLAEHVDDMIYRYEYLPERRFAYVSPASARIVGYTPEEHYKDPDLGRKYISDADLEALQPLLEAGMIAGPLEQQWTHRDGHEVWIEQRNVPILDDAGRLVAVEGISRDITHRKLAEAERESLVASIVHDLKNPLTVILGLSRIMRREGISLEMAQQLSSDILAAGNRMASLLDEMLDVSRLSAGNPLDLQTEDVDMVSLALEAAIMDPRVRVEAAEDSVVVNADERRISRILHNLLDNALKYSPESTEVTVAVRDAGDIVEIDVMDKGIGMSEDDRRHLFERFYRGGNARSVSGTGLGLWGSRLIADAHGGNIEIVSSEGEGTTVRVTLPKLPAEVVAPDTAEAGAP